MDNDQSQSMQQETKADVSYIFKLAYGEIGEIQTNLETAKIHFAIDPAIVDSNLDYYYKQTIENNTILASRSHRLTWYVNTLKGFLWEYEQDPSRSYVPPHPNQPSHMTAAEKDFFERKRKEFFESPKYQKYKSEIEESFVRSLHLSQEPEISNSQPPTINHLDRRVLRAARKDKVGLACYQELLEKSEDPVQKSNAAKLIEKFIKNEDFEHLQSMTLDLLHAVGLLRRNLAGRTNVMHAKIKMAEMRLRMTKAATTEEKEDESAKIQEREFEEAFEKFKNRLNIDQNNDATVQKRQQIHVEFEEKMEIDQEGAVGIKKQM